MVNHESVHGGIRRLVSPVPRLGTSPSPTFFCVEYRLSMLGRYSLASRAGTEICFRDIDGRKTSPLGPSSYFRGETVGEGTVVG